MTKHGIKEQPSIGSVITPSGKEATHESFYFWVDDEQHMVEKTQVVKTIVTYPNNTTVTFYGIVDEIARVGMDMSVHDSKRRRGLDLDDTDRARPRLRDGTTYAKVTVLRTSPQVFTPPLEDSPVIPGSHEDVRYAFGFDRIKAGAPVGLIRNGATKTAGPALVDLAYLLGENGAHLNINGVSGVATKTSSLLLTVMSVLQTAARLRREQPSAERLTICPVLFNVKGLDLYWIDKDSKIFKSNPEFLDRWKEMGLEPRPFRNVTFLTPASPEYPDRARRVVQRNDLTPYSWGLGDFIKHDLMGYLFSADDKKNINFSGLLNVLVNRLTAYQNNKKVLAPRQNGFGWNPPEAGYAGGIPQTFEELVELFDREIQYLTDEGKDTSRKFGNAHIATILSFYRRIQRLKFEANGVIAWRNPYGHPPKVVPGNGCEAYVVDIASVGSSDMQRFVIAAVMQALKEERTGPNPAAGIRYLISLDELNQWAGRDQSDATKALFERIAAEMRSMGIILCGAQQFASKVSLKVVENASCKMIGRTGSGELSDTLWKFLSDADKSMVSGFQQGEQMLVMPSFRAPAPILVPFPAWAMRFEEVWDPNTDGAPLDEEVSATPAVTTASALDIFM